MQTRHNLRFVAHRRGSAVVEAALMLPLLIGITFGAVDIAQYINLSHIVANASREGALKASDHQTASAQDVEAAIKSFMADSVEGLTMEELAMALVVQVHDETGQPVAEGNLSSIPTGQAIRVSVAFDFSFVRWLRGPNYWNNNVQESQSVGRRE